MSNYNIKCKKFFLHK